MPPEQLSPMQDPRPAIEEIRARILPQGNVDFEMNALNEIRRKFETGEYTAIQSLTAAQDILDHRIER